MERSASCCLLSIRAISLSISTMDKLFSKISCSSSENGNASAGGIGKIHVINNDAISALEKQKDLIRLFKSVPLLGLNLYIHMITVNEIVFTKKGAPALAESPLNERVSWVYSSFTLID
ncbi:hypothetical protein D3C77_378330 [compost metagenome]